MGDGTGQDTTGAEIAVIGMACRFPGARNVDEFWRNLRDGVESVTFYSDEELLAAGVSPELLNDPNYVRSSASVEGIDRFDAAFFGYNPHEASTLDPQQRLFLQTAWESLEHAGYDPGAYDGAIGVFTGIGHSQYLQHNLNLEAAATDPAEQYSLLTGNDKDFLPTRVSYKLNLRGPSINVQTACSTSLVAIHLACQSLLSGECDMSLAGGVTLHVPPRTGYLYQEGMILSPDGHCRAFDAEASGTIGGDGVGVVLLKRLEDALEDGDTIHAVIRGTAINNDGSAKIGYTAPSVEGQAAVISEALAVSEVDPATIGYIETHGTGTVLGDPIEIAALNRAFAESGKPAGSCPIGSVKTNVGHLDTAAGVASVIKTVLALEHKQIPPSLNFTRPNPKIQFEEGPFFVNSRLTPWKADGTPRRAGISSFGIGGTNAHAVLEEALPREAGEPSERDWRPFLLTAKNEEALRALAGRYVDFLAEAPETDLDDLCYTAAFGRARFSHRLAVVADTTEALHNVLAKVVRDEAAGEVVTGEALPEPVTGPVFLFTGQGAQSVNMGRDLYASEDVFREAVDTCCDKIDPLLDRPLRDLLFPEPGDEEEAAALLSETGWTQPALFVIEYALAELWASLGVEPSVMIGHSIGELVAACRAGVFSLEDALKLVAARGRLMQNLPKNGTMAALFATEADVASALETVKGKVDIAAINGPGSVVISGETKAVKKVCAALEKQGVHSKELKVSHAFHSPLMEPMLEEFAKVADGIEFHSPQRPMISNVSGHLAGDEVATPDYWVTHVRHAVRFADGMATLFEMGYRIFIEAGPRPVLCTLGETCRPDDLDGNLYWLPSLVPGEMDSARFFRSFGGLAVAGWTVDWDNIFGDAKRRRIPLPTYPFQETSFWVEPEGRTASPSREGRSGQAVLTPDIKGKQIMQATTNQGADFDARKRSVLSSLATEIKRISGLNVEDAQAKSNLFHLGLDSLMLVRVRQAIEKQYALSIPMSRFYSEVDTLDKLAEHICRNSNAGNPEPSAPPVPAGGNGHPGHDGRTWSVEPAPAAAPVPPVEMAPAPGVPADANLIERVAARQMQEMSRFMTQQLATLQGTSTGVSLPAAGNAPAAAQQAAPESVKKKAGDIPKHLSMFQNFEKEDFTPQQQKFLDDLIERYTKRTPKSKASISKYRPWFSDWINAVNFRFSLKEILYPIVAHTSKGSRLWDIDGNEYIDMAMGYGVNFLGNRPDFVEKAIEKQLHEGIQLGPQFDMTGETAELLCELTGVERVTFTNTGTEAMMVAVRIARAATGRDKIVVFQGSYHGMFDGLMVTPTEDGTVPAFPGIPQGMVDDVIMLNYGAEDALETIRSLGSELAAVVVEPVQSRRPGFQPRDYLHELRRIADETGAALVFDEIITGFRISPGGAQEYFDVRADIVAYGKVVGGGMPIGIIAGKAKFMNMIDGGTWTYGDASYPKSGTTVFAGTFCKHPLTIASMNAVLKYLKEQGPSLQEGVNRRAARLVDTLNEFYTEERVPIRIKRFGSQFRFESFGEYDLLKNPVEMEIYFYLLMEKGIYTWERHICFLSTAHTDEEVDTVIRCAKEAIHELRAGGFSFATPVEESVNG